MVMTDYMWHLMFEPTKESECMILMNEIRTSDNKGKLDKEKKTIDIKVS